MYSLTILSLPPNNTSRTNSAALSNKNPRIPQHGSLVCQSQGRIHGHPSLPSSIVVTSDSAVAHKCCGGRDMTRQALAVGRGAQKGDNRVFKVASGAADEHLMVPLNSNRNRVCHLGAGCRATHGEIQAGEKRRWVALLGAHTLHPRNLRDKIGACKHATADTLGFSPHLQRDGRAGAAVRSKPERKK